jgi:hypothetical protein
MTLRGILRANPIPKLISALETGTVLHCRPQLELVGAHYAQSNESDRVQLSRLV